MACFWEMDDYKYEPCLKVNSWIEHEKNAYVLELIFSDTLPHSGMNDRMTNTSHPSPWFWLMSTQQHKLKIEGCHPLLVKPYWGILKFLI